MNTILKSQSSLFASILIGSIAALLIPAKGLADAYFIGSAGDHNLTTGSNWVGGSPSGDWERMFFGSAVVDGTLNLNNFNGRSGITLTSGLTQDITIVNNQPLIMASVGGDGFIDMSAATHNLTIYAQYWDWSPIEWNVGAGATLFVNGGIYENGPHSLTKDGAGNAWITAAGNRTGTTAINGGALVALRSTLGTGAVTINNGGTLYVNDQWVLCGVNGVGVAEQNVASVTVNAGGQLALDGGNGYANGATNLYLNGGSVTGGPDNSSPFGGLYLYNGNEQITAGGATTSTISTILALTGNNNSITVGAGSALNITSILKNGIFDGSAAGGIIKAGAGTLTLSGANSYTGTTTISGGTLEIGGTGTLGGGNYAGDISNGGALLYSSSANQTLSGFITGSGSITMSGSGTLTLTQTFNDFPTHYFNGAITVNSGTLIAPNEYWTLNPTSITVNGGILNMQTRPSELGYLALNGGTVTSNGVENTSFGNIILYTDTTVPVGGAAVSTISVNQVKLRGTNSFDVGAGSTLNLTSEVGEYGGAGSLNKTGAGTLTLSGNNTYTGVTTLAGGMLNVASLSDYGVAGSLGNRAAVDDAPGIVGILFQGGTLQYTGSTAQSTNRGIRISTVGGGATIDASGSNPAATLSFTATSSPDFFENGGNRTLTLTGSNTGANTFAMGIGDAIGTTSVVKSGAGQWVLTGANTYTGGTMVSVGTLKVASATALGGNSGAVSVTSGAVLDLNGTTMTNTNALTLNGTGISSGGALTNSSGTAATYVGAVTLQTSSSMGGTGDITLSNTVTGGAGVTLTKVGGDTLNINGAVSDGTTLAANGGTTNVNAAFGTGTSNVSVTGAGTTLKFGSVSQTLSSLTIGAGSTVTFTSGLASFSGGGGKGPSFGGTSTVPEPGTLGLLLVGVLGMLNRRRRQA